MAHALVDIGNTSIDVKIYVNSNQSFNFQLNRTDKALLFLCSKLSLQNIFISSVSPSINRKIESFQNPNVYFFTHNDFKDLVINIEPIESIGIDRLVNIVAALYKYHSNTIIVDAGTAITCCYINKKGEYDGGIILPGFHMVNSALKQNTEKLPLIPFPINQPELIGKSTKYAIESGLFFGSMHMINGVIDDIKQTYPEATVILTGGVPKELLKYINFDIFDYELQFFGMQKIVDKLFNIT